MFISMMRVSRSSGARAYSASSFGRKLSISSPYCTPDGHAVTHALHQVNSASRRVEFRTGFEIGRAGREAKAAVDARFDHVVHTLNYGISECFFRDIGFHQVTS